MKEFIIDLLDVWAAFAVLILAMLPVWVFLGAGIWLIWG